MKKLKDILLLLFLIAPLTALAHAEGVLTTVFLEFIVLVIILVGLLVIKLNIKGKLLLGGIYILATALTLIFVYSLAYNQHQTMINVIVVAVPLTTVATGYIGFKNWF